MSLLALARDNKWQDIERLVERGVPVMTANQMGQTAIHIASLWGNVETIQALLRLGADANAENVRGSVPLHFAAGAKDNAHEACKVGCSCCRRRHQLLLVAAGPCRAGREQWRLAAPMRPHPTSAPACRRCWTRAPAPM
jgi:hypothetical protein